MLLNLIINAADALETLPDKRISLEVADSSDTIEMVISDNGHLIPAKVRAAMFQPFFTIKEVSKGTRLGLSISKGLIESHGGTLELDSASVQTRFVVRLPKNHS